MEKAPTGQELKKALSCTDEKCYMDLSAKYNDFAKYIGIVY